jgi:hypothetical protein
MRDRHLQLTPGTETYLEILWGRSWLVGTAGGATFYVRTLPQQLGRGLSPHVDRQGSAAGAVGR